MIACNPMPWKYIYILIPPKKERFRIFLQRWMGFLLVCKGRPWQKQARYLLPTVLTLTSGWIWAVPARWGCKTGHQGAQQKSSIDQQWINEAKKRELYHSMCIFLLGMPGKIPKVTSTAERAEEIAERFLHLFKFSASTFYTNTLSAYIYMIWFRNKGPSTLFSNHEVTNGQT